VTSRYSDFLFVPATILPQWVLGQLDNVSGRVGDCLHGSACNVNPFEPLAKQLIVVLAGGPISHDGNRSEVGFLTRRDNQKALAIPENVITIPGIRITRDSAAL